MGAATSRPSEDTPLTERGANKPLATGHLQDSAAVQAGGDGTDGVVEQKPFYLTPEFYTKYAAALSIVLYIAVAVTKTLLTKTLLLHASTPVALSAMSCIVTCITLVPLFLLKPAMWGVLDCRKNGMGFLFVTVLVTLDLAFTNIAVSLLSVSIQQTLLATNPVATVIIESVVRRKLANPVRRRMS